MQRPALYSSSSRPGQAPPGGRDASGACEGERPAPPQPNSGSASGSSSASASASASTLNASNARSASGSAQPAQAASPQAVPPASSQAARFGFLQRLSARRLLWPALVLLILLLGVNVSLALRPVPEPITQKDINAAVLKTLESGRLPSPAAKAYQAIRPSVVRVTGEGENTKNQDGAETAERSVGTGVVIMDKGVILTNLHVVQGAGSIKVRFADGTESSASITGVQPENDLAVLQADKIPDDLQAATLRSTAGLLPGDQVAAVGYPFGIGPSTSAGVISGLKRTFRSPEGKQQMSNLIQFDAAANPGNSGGPLVTMEGEVIGIVTAIYNPNEQRTFVGIGFAVPIENAASAAGMSPF